MQRGLLLAAASQGDAAEDEVRADYLHEFLRSLSRAERLYLSAVPQIAKTTMMGAKALKSCLSFCELESGRMAGRIFAGLCEVRLTNDQRPRALHLLQNSLQSTVVPRH